LCLDGGVDDDDAGQPLRRDCACRGTDAGFVHLSCLADYAETKSEQARGMNAFRDPWKVCPGCHQEYQNELAIDTANKFLLFVRRQSPDNKQRQVESLYVKLHALMKMFDRLQPVQKREAGVTANVLLSLIDRMKHDAPPLSKRYSEIGANAYNAHGRIALQEGTKESARRAVTHFENALEVHETIGHVEGIAIAKSIIAVAKSKYEGGNIEEVLEASQELYELRVSKYGEEDGDTIDAGIMFADKLQDANRGGEARELLAKLLATSKRVLGSHHNTTKEIKSTLKWSEARESLTNCAPTLLFFAILIGFLAMLYQLAKSWVYHSGSMEHKTFAYLFI
jgi:hypothetical protein